MGVLILYILSNPIKIDFNNHTLNMFKNKLAINSQGRLIHEHARPDGSSSTLLLLTMASPRIESHSFSLFHVLSDINISIVFCKKNLPR